jgi:hypothetical protein
MYKVRKLRYAKAGVIFLLPGIGKRKAAFSKTVTRFWKISSFASYPWRSSRLERVYERAVTPLNAYIHPRIVHRFSPS